jgi:hypothetical protein
MTCPTCRSDSKADTCGCYDGKACKCCGMLIIATAETTEQSEEVFDNEGQQG